MSDSKVYMLPDGSNNSINPALMLALSQNGGFGNGANWMWPMFMFFLFPWLFGGNGFGGFGGFGNGAAGSIAGTGYLANQLNNDVGRDLLIQAINGRADALTSLAQLLHTDVSTVQNGVNSIQSAVQTVGSQVGLTGAQVINSIQSGNASLSQQLCQCCCDNRLAIAEQTTAIQSQAAANHSAQSAQAASNFAAQQLQAAQNHADDRLDICQQTNTLQNQAERDTNTIVGAIAALQTNVTKEFCDIKEREMQSKIDTQGDIITQLRGQLDNDRQTAQLYSAIAPIQAKVNEIANKQPNTVPVEWPNLTAVNNTPYAGGYFGYGNGWFGNGWSGSFWG